jgi:hypothetical protein
MVQQDQQEQMELTVLTEQLDQQEQMELTELMD